MRLHCHTKRTHSFLAVLPMTKSAQCYGGMNIFGVALGSNWVRFANLQLFVILIMKYTQ